MTLFGKRVTVDISVKKMSYWHMVERGSPVLKNKCSYKKRKSVHRNAYTGSHVNTEIMLTSQEL